MSYLVTHLWNKRRTSWDGLHNPRWRQPLFCIKPTKRWWRFLEANRIKWEAGEKVAHWNLSFYFADAKKLNAPTCQHWSSAEAYLFCLLGLLLLLLLIFILLCLLRLINPLLLLWAAVTLGPCRPPWRSFGRLKVDPCICRPIWIFTRGVAEHEERHC